MSWEDPSIVARYKEPADGMNELDKLTYKHSWTLEEKADVVRLVAQEANKAINTPTDWYKQQWLEQTRKFQKATELMEAATGEFEKATDRLLVLTNNTRGGEQ